MCWTRCVPVIAAAALLAGCAYRLPPGYVKTDDPGDAEFRAVSAAGSVLTHRVETNPENGDVAFWEKAITARLVEVRGYQLVERKEIRSGATPGVEMTFNYNHAGVDYVYVAAVYVRGRSVHVLEAAGTRDTFTPDLPEIRKAIASWPL